MTDQHRDLFPAEEDKSLMTAFSWWEKRRVTFNLVVGTTGVLILLSLSSFSFNDIIAAIIYGIFANIFYCLGFILEMADKYYFRSTIGLAERRSGIFGCGLIVAVGVTVAAGFVAGLTSLL